MEEYYYGVRVNFIDGNVQRIYNSVLNELKRNETRTFVVVEQAFFSKWYLDLTEQGRGEVRVLVQNGQIEFTNGGWVMCDGLVTYHDDIVEQYTLGHMFLEREFAVVPKIAWQIDSFGHSMTFAALLSEMGFEAVVLSRIPAKQKVCYQRTMNQEVRLSESSLEFIWQPQRLNGLDHSIFTHVTYAHYNSPSEYCFDQSCFDEEIWAMPAELQQNLPPKMIEI